MFELRTEAGFRGVWITFANGYKVSVQWGSGSYSDNHNLFSGDYLIPKDSKTAEIAAWNTNDNDKWYIPEGWDDSIKGYCTPEEVAAFIQEVANL
jgi:hypothetical protein